MVRCAHNGEFRTYEIYCRNEPYLRPAPGVKLGRAEAYAIAKLFNTGSVSLWS